MNDNVRSTTNAILLHQARRNHPTLEEDHAGDKLLDIWITGFVIVAIFALIAIILYLPSPHV